MSAAPRHVETDVLIIGIGRRRHVCGDRGRARGRSVLLADRSLIGRGGATVMAQMTVAVALGEETPDHWQHHSTTRSQRAAACATSAWPPPVRGGPACIREMDDWGVGWARKDGRITQVHRARPRPAALRLCRLSQHRPGGIEDAARRGRHAATASARPATSCVIDLVARGGEVTGAVALHISSGAAGHHRRQGDDRGDRRAHPALPAQQRLRQYGRRRLCAGAARRRAADRHGVRAVLSRSGTSRRG